MASIMLNLLELGITELIKQLCAGYSQICFNQTPKHLVFLTDTTHHVMQILERSTALYHNAEHTILATIVGQEILRGKQQLEGNVSSEDWLHYLLALLCHDVGFVGGACRRDRILQRQYHTGKGDQLVTLPRASTDASLGNYHVDRSQQFIAEFISETLGDRSFVTLTFVQECIERTRFPVPDKPEYQIIGDYPGLARAADLIGQLSDPQYLQKTTALFYEFEETGTNKTLGYCCPDDVWANYPKFFCTVVDRYIGGAVRYLNATSTGRAIVQRLYRNLVIAERRRQMYANKSEAYRVSTIWHTVPMLGQ